MQSRSDFLTSALPLSFYYSKQETTCSRWKGFALRGNFIFSVQMSSFTLSVNLTIICPLYDLLFLVFVLCICCLIIEAMSHILCVPVQSVHNFLCICVPKCHVSYAGYSRITAPDCHLRHERVFITITARTSNIKQLA